MGYARSLRGRRVARTTHTYDVRRGYSCAGANRTPRGAHKTTHLRAHTCAHTRKRGPSLPLPSRFKSVQSEAREEFRVPVSEAITRNPNWIHLYAKRDRSGHRDGGLENMLVPPACLWRFLEPDLGGESVSSSVTAKGDLSFAGVLATIPAHSRLRRDLSKSPQI